MAKSANLIPTLLNPTLKFLPHIQTRNINLIASSSTKSKHLLHSDSPLIENGKTMTCRASRRLITISTGDAKWHGDWTCDYVVSLQDLHLEDLVESETEHHKHNQNPQVFVNLSIQKHASFGLSVDGRVITSFTRKCSTCSSPYCRQIDAKFKVWILLASRENRKIQLPEIGGDPSVIYVKPGYEADLDSLVQDTIRLTTPVKDTCCDLCEKSEATIQFTGGKKKSCVDKRWSRLLELKNRIK